jgi:hypothetical protein
MPIRTAELKFSMVQQLWHSDSKVVSLLRSTLELLQGVTLVGSLPFDFCSNVTMVHCQRLEL